MTITALQATINTDITSKVVANTITPANCGDNMAAIVDEIKDRGIVMVDATSDLATTNSNNGTIVLVKNVGFFRDTATGPADSIIIFDGVGGRFWELYFGHTLPIVIRKTTDYVSNLGMSGGGSEFNTIPELTVDIPPDTDFDLEMELLMEDNSAGFVQDFKLIFSEPLLRGHIMYQYLGVDAAGGEPTSIGKGKGNADNHTDTASFENTINGGGFAKMRITAYGTTGPTDPSTVTVKAGIFASTGVFYIHLDSFLKVAIRPGTGLP